MVLDFKALNELDIKRKVADEYPLLRDTEAFREADEHDLRYVIMMCAKLSPVSQIRNHEERKKKVQTILGKTFSDEKLGGLITHFFYFQDDLLFETYFSLKISVQQTLEKLREAPKSEDELFDADNALPEDRVWNCFKQKDALSANVVARVREVKRLGEELFENVELAELVSRTREKNSRNIVESRAGDQKKAMSKFNRG